MSSFIFNIHFYQKKKVTVKGIYNTLFSYISLGGNMRLSDLQNKDIVNVNDGKNIGSIIDVKIDEASGNIVSFIIEPNKNFFKFFNNITYFTIITIFIAFLYYLCYNIYNILFTR